MSVVLGRPVLLRLVPTFFAVHNLEEAVAMKRRLQAALPASLRRIVGAFSYGQFVVIALTLIGFLIAVLGDLADPASIAGYALLALQATLFLNVFSHVAGAVTLRGYSFGLATALLINLPLSLVLAVTAWTGHWYSEAALIGLVALALVLHGPVFIGLLRLASRLPIR